MPEEKAELTRKPLPCVEVLNKTCSGEARRFRPDLEWSEIVYMQELDAARIKALGNHVYIAGVFDFLTMMVQHGLVHFTCVILQGLRKKYSTMRGNC